MRWQERAARVAALAEAQGGVLSRRQLRELGISRHEVKREGQAGRWRIVGKQTVVVRPDVRPPAHWFRAIWESGERARLDGVSALQYAGLQQWDASTIHVSVPRGSHARRVEGVRIHAVRALEPPVGTGVPTTLREIAAIRAAQWAPTDRAAITLLAMSVQQRIVAADRLLAAWHEVARSRRRAILEQAIQDICAGAESLGELDFAVLCRARGLPEPTRQVVRGGPRGRIYLDVVWEHLGIAVEIDGAQHVSGLATVEDALRDNVMRLQGTLTLRIPVLGLRAAPDAFMDQVESALTRARDRQSVRAE